ncbi:hypothetical protein Tco_0219166 [Tanacetum coccineum]
MMMVSVVLYPFDPAQSLDEKVVEQYAQWTQSSKGSMFVDNSGCTVGGCDGAGGGVVACGSGVVGDDSLDSLRLMKLQGRTLIRAVLRVTRVVDEALDDLVMVV